MKTCIECKLEKAECDFYVSKHTESKTYTTLKCKQCQRGRLKGFAGKISPEELKSLIENKADYFDPKVHVAEFYDKCNLKMSKQAFYRYNRLGDVGSLMKTL